MDKLTRQDLYSLEQYAEHRTDIRARVMAHKQDRKVHIGPNATLYFEDRQTIQYQIQEMLRVERIFEASGIGEELAAYNPLIPDGRTRCLPGWSESRTRSGYGWTAAIRSWPSPTRTSIAKPLTRHRRCISCASSCPMPWSPA